MMLSLLNRGIELFNNEININTIMKKVRRNGIYMNKLTYSKDINFEIKYDKKNIIDVDDVVHQKKATSSWVALTNKMQDS